MFTTIGITQTFSIYFKY
jgi:hypothetical protein